MLVVMWAQRPNAGCALAFEPPRYLVLSRETDREHLVTDVASIDRIARRAAGDHGQDLPFAQCQATLLQQLASRHGLSPDDMHSAPAPAR